jgi:hypothetical protein
MTPQELASDIRNASVELLQSRDLPVSDAMLDLLDWAAMTGFKLGSQYTLSMVRGSIAVQMAKIDK